MALCDNLKNARNRMGLSQEAVAEELGISRQAVTKWELGQSKPSAKNLKALTELYQISYEELISEGPNLILRANLTKWAIVLQAAFLCSCSWYAYTLRDNLDDVVYRGAFVFSLIMLLSCSIWMAANHRYELDREQRRKNRNIEFAYIGIQTALVIVTVYWGIGLFRIALILFILFFYILYVNPRFMKRKLTR